MFRGLGLMFGLLAFAATGARAQAAPNALVVAPANDAIFEAFRSHPLVGLGDVHGVAQEAEFFTQLVRDPRFATEVGNAVVEFGSAAHQETLDRYLQGEDVPFEELRKVWLDAVGWSPTVTQIGYQTFFAQVRATNLELPPAKRIRVWLGEPPVDWSRIQSNADLRPWVEARDSHAADVIRTKVLDQGRKALVIYGTLHFYKPPPPSPGLPSLSSLKLLVEKDHPGAFFVVAPYVGYTRPACALAFEAQFKWEAPTLAAPIRGTNLEAEILRPGCDFGRGGPPPPPPPGVPAPSAAEQAQRRATANRLMSGVEADALLYLGPAATLTRSADDVSILMDTAYFNEISRRMRVRTGRSASFADWTKNESQADRWFAPR